MKFRYLAVTALLVSMATPALAAQYFVAQDSSTKKCMVVEKKPDGTAMKMVGSAHKSEAEAKKAMSSNDACK